MKPRLTVIGPIKIAAFQIKDRQPSFRFKVANEYSEGKVSPSHPSRAVWVSNLRRFWLVLCFLVVHTSAMSTTMIIHKTATSIFAGADSKQSGGTTKSVYDAPLADKILMIKKDWYFAAAHHASIKITPPNASPMIFDVDSTMRQCASRAVSTPDLSLREFADSCSTEIKGEVRPILQIIRNSNPPPTFYYNNFANKVILELVFFGRDKGSLVAYRRDIHACSGPESACPSSTTSRCVQFVRPLKRSVGRLDVRIHELLDK